MYIGMIGLGRMGLNMTQRLLQGGHRVVALDQAAAAVQAAASHGATAAGSEADLLGKLPSGSPRIVWIMVPAGAPVDGVIAGLTPHLKSGDIIVDGGNSRYTDSVRRAGALAELGVHFLDCGTSGGIWGLAEGYCLMVGGDKAAFDQVEPVLASLAPPGGYLYAGGSGAGHYAKMVHNGIEYGLLQAYGEGFAVLHAAPYQFDLQKLAALWNHGSVVRSWLLELAERAFAREGGDLADVKAWVADSGEGRWTVQEALDLNVATPVLNLSLLMRLRSRDAEGYSDKLIAALRGEFGGHLVQKEGAGE